MPNAIYNTPGTPTTFQDSGADVTLTLASLASGAGRLSAEWDRGAGAQPSLYLVQLRYRANAAPTVSPTNMVRLYLATRHGGTYRSGGLGAVDAAVSSETLFALCEFVGGVEIIEASTTRDHVRTWPVWIAARWVSVGTWNATGQALHATAANNEVRFTPVPWEIQ